MSKRPNSVCKSSLIVQCLLLCTNTHTCIPSLTLSSSLNIDISWLIGLTSFCFLCTWKCACACVFVERCSVSSMCCEYWPRSVLCSDWLLSLPCLLSLSHRGSLYAWAPCELINVLPPFKSHCNLIFFSALFNKFQCLCFFLILHYARCIKTNLSDRG